MGPRQPPTFSRLSEEPGRHLHAKAKSKRLVSALTSRNSAVARCMRFLPCLLSAYSDNTAGSSSADALALSPGIQQRQRAPADETLREWPYSFKVSRTMPKKSKSRYEHFLGICYGATTCSLALPDGGIRRRPRPASSSALQHILITSINGQNYINIFAVLSRYP